MNIYFKNLFEGLKISVRAADLTKCWDDWGDENFIGDYSKFYFFLGGSGEIIIDGKNIDPKPGQLLLIPAHKKHTFRTDPQESYFKYWCHFDCLLNEKSIFNTQ